MDGRWIVVGMFAVFALLLEATALAARKPVFELPPFAWFGPMPPYFADLRGLVSWSDQYHAGARDLSQLRDQWNRPFTYPHAWLYLHNLGITGATVVPVSYAIDALFFASALYVLGRLSVFGGLAAGLFLISYAVMLAVERANADVAMFSVLALALAFRRALPAAALAIGTTAILKVHPLFAFGALVKPPWKRSLTWLGAGIVAFIVAFTWDAHELMTVASGVQNFRTGLLSFGMLSLGLELIDCYHQTGHYIVVVGASVVLAILASGAAAWFRPSLAIDEKADREVFAFRIGGGIYIGSFLLGTNHDYRGIFLLFCLPLIFRLLAREPRQRWCSPR